MMMPIRVMTVCVAIAAMPSASFAQEPFVKLEQVGKGDNAIRRVFFGRVVARQTVDLAFQVGGQIVAFPVEEGTAVSSGALVAKLDQEPFELALDEARAQHTQASRALERYKKLVGGTISQASLQDAETQAELTGIAVRNSERALAKATLHAPFDAVVASRLVPNFSTVDAGTPVARLHDLSELRIEIDVPETLFQRTGRGPDIEVFAQFPSSARAYPLELREFNAETAQVGQTYSITLGMPPPDDLVVLPGSSAKVTAVLKTDAARMTVPASAVVVANDGSASVMVFSPAGADAGTVASTPVEIRPTDDGAVEIVSGLESGQEVVAVGAARLEDGASVRRFTGFGE